MDKIREIIRKKPRIFLFADLIYLFLVGILTWQIHPPLGAFWYLLGGILGIFFLDFSEVIFNLTPSPFRSVVFAVPFAGVSFFIVTSSGSTFASGLVLSIYLTMILWQLGEWKALGNLQNWFAMVASPVTLRVQRLSLAVFIGLFLVLTYLFIRTQ